VATPEANVGKSLQFEPVWLVSHGRVLAAAGRATTRTSRRRGLIGVPVVEQPLVLSPCAWVHTFGMRTDIETIFLSDDGVVLAMDYMKPWRLGTYTRFSRTVIETSPGSCERWGIKLGDEIEVRDVI